MFTTISGASAIHKILGAPQYFFVNPQCSKDMLSVIYGALLYPMCLSPVFQTLSHRGRTLPYGLQNHKKMNSQLLVEGWEGWNPQSTWSAFPKLLILGVISKNFEKGKRV